MLTPTFHFQILEDFIQVFNEQSKICVEILQKKVGKGSFDIFPYITHCTLDIICGKLIQIFQKYTNIKQGDSERIVRHCIMVIQNVSQNARKLE